MLTLSKSFNKLTSLQWNEMVLSWRRWCQYRNRYIMEKKKKAF